MTDLRKLAFLGLPLVAVLGNVTIGDFLFAPIRGAADDVAQVSGYPGTGSILFGTGVAAGMIAVVVTMVVLMGASAYDAPATGIGRVCSRGSRRHVLAFQYESIGGKRWCEYKMDGRSAHRYNQTCRHSLEHEQDHSCPKERKNGTD